MNKNYDKHNIFAKILRSEIPCHKILENDHALAFSDINPQSPIHILIIPKEAYLNFHDFMENASIKEIEFLWKLVNDVIKLNKISKKGFRIISNSGDDGNQDVPHFHVHVLGGKNLGRICLLYTSPSPRDLSTSRMPSSA